jgi:hypothetical protein
MASGAGVICVQGDTGARPSGVVLYLHMRHELQGGTTPPPPCFSGFWRPWAVCVV